MKPQKNQQQQFYVYKDSGFLKQINLISNIYYIKIKMIEQMQKSRKTMYNKELNEMLIKDTVKKELLKLSCRIELDEVKTLQRIYSK